MNASSVLSPLTSSAGDSMQIATERMALMGRKKMTEGQAETAAKDFESMFLAQMLENMFGESVGEDAFGDSESNDIYKGLMVNEYAKKLTASGGIGIADYIKTELLKTQEV